MRLTLRRQLFAISALALALPAAALWYVRASEQALRDTQASFLSTIAQSLAPTLIPALAPPPAGSRDAQIFVEPLPRAPLLDGFAADWDTSTEPTAGVDGGDALQVLAGSREGALFLHADVHHAADRMPRFNLSCTSAGGDLLLATLEPRAPGELTVAGLTPDAPPMRAAWVPDEHGSQLELRLPDSPCERQLGVWIDLGDTTLATHTGGVPGALITLDRTLAEVLATNRPVGIDAFVTTPEGWRVTPIMAGTYADANLQSAARPPGWYRRLYGTNTDSLPVAARGFDQRDDWLAPVSDGQLVWRRARLEDTRQVVTEVAMPLVRDGAVQAALVLRQPTAAILTLANPARARMTTVVLALTAALVVLLLVFASVLSIRVRRLARAAGSALDTRGRLTTAMPGDTAGDELGDVARGFQRLLERVAEQQSWLQSLADTLSHELRTPIAVVQSSLENLAHELDQPPAREALARATDGVHRLQATLAAMTGANRAEQAVRDAVFDAVDLSALTRQLQQAYASTFTGHRIGGTVQNGVLVSGNPELLVQALDKLVENAVTFAPPGTTITIGLATIGEHAELYVENSGSALPDGAADALFAPLVSRRTDDREGHLGLGLYIARMICEGHGGTISAGNTDVGVRFTVRLPRAEKKG